MSLAAPTGPTSGRPLPAGFADPVSGAQATFRALLEATARPGRIETLETLPEAPEGVTHAFAAACLSLLDVDTRVWMDAPARDALAGWLAFHCGCPVVAAQVEADFALILDPSALPALDRFCWGTAEAPEAGASLLLQVETLSAGDGWRLTGPGIAVEAQLAVGGLPADFVARRRAVEASAPCGVEFFFFCGSRLAALPRSTRATAKADGAAWTRGFPCT